MIKALPITAALLAAFAISAPIAAQRRPGFIRFEGGAVTLHRSKSDGAMQGIRFGRALGPRGRFRADLGITHGTADQGYWTAEIGVEARPFPRARITPVLGVATGLLAEPEFGGPLVSIDAALDVRLSPRAGLRVGVRRAEHGGESGPDLIYGGIEVHGP